MADPRKYRTLQHRHEAIARPQSTFTSREMVLYEVLKERMSVATTDSDFNVLKLYMEVSSKITLMILYQIFRTGKRKVMLALKCMANYKFSA